jgi:branched-chain amino acid transport system substrate-binding protein
MLRIAITTFIFLGCFFLFPNVSGAKPIKLGASVPLSGPAYLMGQRLLEAEQAYFLDVNKAGGVNGQPINLIAYDDQYDPKLALKNTVKLIQADKADMLFGYLGTPPLTQILPLLILHSKKPLYMFFPLTGAKIHRIPPYNSFVFNLRDSYKDETKALVDNLVAQGFRRFAIFYQCDSYGRSGWEGLKEALAAYDLTILKEVTYTRGDTFSTSYKKQVDLLKQVHPQVILVVGTYAPTAAFVRDARDAGMNQVISTLSFVSSFDLASYLNMYSKKTKRDYTRNVLVPQILPHFMDPALPAAKEYRDFALRHKMAYNFVGFEGFLNAKLMTQILKSIPAPFTRDKLRQQMSVRHAYDIGLSQPVYLGGKEHQGLKQIFFTYINRDGAVLPLTDWPRP